MHEGGASPSENSKGKSSQGEDKTRSMVRNESVISDLTADTSMMTATPIKDNNVESVATTTDKEMIDGKEK